jgi:hypothetical protein
MRFRLQFGLLIGLIFSAASASAMHEHHDSNSNASQQEESKKMLVNALYHCALETNLCSAACQNHQNHEGHIFDCAPLCRDTSEICALAAKLVAFNTPLADSMAGQAVIACGQCFDICKNHDDPNCQNCAAACAEYITLYTER